MLKIIFSKHYCRKLNFLKTVSYKEIFFYIYNLFLPEKIFSFRLNMNKYSHTKCKNFYTRTYKIIIENNIDSKGLIYALLLNRHKLACFLSI